MERVLIIKLSAFGDIIQAAGAIHDIRCHHPTAIISLMTSPPYQRLLARCPWVDRLFIDPRESRFRLDKMLALRRRLRQEGFTMVYDLQQVGRTNFYYHWMLRDLAWLGDARGCSHYLRRPADRCAADHFQLSLAQAGIATTHCLAGDVAWMADDVDELLRARQLTGDFIVLIAGGSAAHPEKRWPFYRELAAYLLSRGLRVVTMPGPDEMDLCRQIGGDMLTGADGYLDQFQLAGVLRRAAFVVGNDTGPTHLAAHLRRPGLALFSRHFPASCTGIQHTRFRWMESPDLNDLPLAAVIAQVEAGRSAAAASAASPDTSHA